MSRAVILRHGNTFDPGDVVTRVGGRTDAPLSNSGRAQVEEVATALSERAFTFARILSSPLARTMETARIVGGRLAPKAPLEPLESLREIDYGPDENKPEAEVLARIGAAALAAWEEHATPPPDWRVDPSALTLAWKTLFETLVRAEGDSLIVTSNGVARFALDAAHSRPADAPRKLKTAAYGVVRLAPAGAEILEWNVRAGR